MAALRSRELRKRKDVEELEEARQFFTGNARARGSPPEETSLTPAVRDLRTMAKHSQQGNVV